jgi:hypothetical protein
MPILFCLYLRSYISTLILYSCWYHFWTNSSSSSTVRSYVVLSNCFATLLTCFSNSASWSVASTFCFSLTSSGVVIVIFSFSSSICFLYWLIVWEIGLSFSFVIGLLARMLSRRCFYIVVTPCSILSARSFSYLVSNLTCLKMSSNYSFSFLIPCSSITSVVTHDYTSCTTLTWSL